MPRYASGALWLETPSRATPRPVVMMPMFSMLLQASRRFMIALGNRKGDPQQGRSYPGHRQNGTPEQRRVVKKGQGAEDAVQPHLQHDARHHGRDVAGGVGMGRGEPDMERHDAGLGAETGKGRQRNDHGSRRQRRKRTGRRQEKRTGLGRQQRKIDIQCRGAGVGRNQIDDPGPPDILAFMLRHQQEIGGKRHDLPHHQEEDAVAGGEQNRHR